MVRGAPSPRRPAARPSGQAANRRGIATFTRVHNGCVPGGVTRKRHSLVAIGAFSPLRRFVATEVPRAERPFAVSAAPLPGSSSSAPPAWARATCSGGWPAGPRTTGPRRCFPSQHRRLARAAAALPAARLGQRSGRPQPGAVRQVRAAAYAVAVDPAADAQEAGAAARMPSVDIAARTLEAIARDVDDQGDVARALEAFTALGAKAATK